MMMVMLALLLFFAFVYSLYSTYLHSFTYHVPLARFYFTSSSFPSKCTFTLKLKLTHTHIHIHTANGCVSMPSGFEANNSRCVLMSFFLFCFFFILLVVHFYLLSRTHTHWLTLFAFRCSSAELFQCNVNRIWNRTKWHFNLHVRAFHTKNVNFLQCVAK